MTLFFNKLDRAKENEIKALLLLDKNKISNAEKLLLKNFNSNTSSTLTYDLLIKIYNQNKDYSSLIKVLNAGIVKTSKNNFYRKLKKAILLSKLIQDIEDLN